MWTEIVCFAAFSYLALRNPWYFPTILSYNLLSWIVGGGP